MTTVKKSKPPATGRRNMQDSYLRLHQALRKDIDEIWRRLKALEAIQKLGRKGKP